MTHECDFPDGARSKPKLTANRISEAVSSRQIDQAVRTSIQAGKGVYELDFDNLTKAEPDLIFTQELCEVCAVPYSEIHRAAKRLSKKPEIVSLDTFTLGDILAAIELVGSKCEKASESRQITDALKSRIERVERLTSAHGGGKGVFFMEWIDPPMSCGHWMPEVIEKAGGTDLFGVHGRNSRRIDWKEIVEASPEYLIVAPWGFGVERAEVEARQLTNLEGWNDIRAVRDGNVFVSDGNAYFSRPGPRIVDGLEIIASMLNPEVKGHIGKYGSGDYWRLRT